MKIYYKVMAETFYFLGDLASKPLQWEWLNEENPIIVWIAYRIYNVYNWLMLKSVYFNDKGDLDLWTPYESDEKDPEDKFEPKVFAKKDENNL